MLHPLPEKLLYSDFQLNRSNTFRDTASCKLRHFLIILKIAVLVNFAEPYLQKYLQYNAETYSPQWYDIENTISKKKLHRNTFTGFPWCLENQQKYYTLKTTLVFECLLCQNGQTYRPDFWHAYSCGQSKQFHSLKLTCWLKLLV